MTVAAAADSTQTTRDIGTYSNVGKEKGLYDVAKRTYAQQFSQIYFVRLATLLPQLRAAADAKWAALKPSMTQRILEIPENGQLTCILGTIYVEMEFKPNILKELANDLQIVKPAPKEKYTGGRVQYFLEDDSARIEIKFAEGTQLEVVTGVSIALLGQEQEDGSFLVQDYCFVGLETSRPTPLPLIQNDSYVAFVSGVNYDATQNEAISLLVNSLSGNIIGFHLAAHVKRVVFLGNTLRTPPRIDEGGKKKYGVEQARYNFDDMKEMDKALAALSGSIPVDLMPGPTDPANIAMPQLPIHRGILPQASANAGFQTVTNPYSFQQDGINFLACSGQNVDDIYRFSGFNDRLDIACKTLEWRNIAPTAPDTLWCYPFYDRDPFLLQQTPDIYVIGNQVAFGSTVVKRPDGSPVLVVLMPKFHETPLMVLVNMKDLTCKQVYFSPPSEAPQ